MASITVIILAAGKGSRMRSPLAKVLHPLLGKTLLARVIGNVVQAYSEDLARIVVVVGHQQEEVSAELCALSQTYHIPIQTVVQATQQGTGHAVQQVLQAGVVQTETVVLLAGDVPLLRPESLQALVQQQQESQLPLVVQSAVVQDPSGYGRLVLSADGQRVLAIVEEKDATAEQQKITQVNAGSYAMHWPEVAPQLAQLQPNNQQQEYYFTDMVSLVPTGTSVLTDAHDMHGVNSQQNLAMCARLLNQRHIEHLMLNGVIVVDPASTWIAPEVSIGAGTLVYPGCFLEGNVQIGAHCHIGPYAHLRSGVTLADYVRIGNFVELKNTTVGSHTNVSHLSYVGDATLGSRVNIGAGTITANYDSIRQKKHHTVLADDVKTGSNSVLVAPVTVGQGACIGAGTVVRKSIDAYDLRVDRPEVVLKKGWVPHDDA